MVWSTLGGGTWEVSRPLEPVPPENRVPSMRVSSVPLQNKKGDKEIIISLFKFIIIYLFFGRVTRLAGS